MSIRIIHCSDLHLDRNFGYHDLQKIDIKKREIENNFTTIVDVGIDERVDLFLISGDIFDKVNPSNSTRTFLVKEIKRLKDNNIHIFLIGGNHDIPKLGNTSLAIDILESAGLATVFSNTQDFQSKLLNIKNIVVQIIGKSYNIKNQSDNPLRNFKIKKEGRYQICLLHGSLIGMNVSSNIHDRFYNPFSPNDVVPSLDYLALGHYHNKFERKINETMVCNPGSIDKLTWLEANDQKGFFLIDLNSKNSISNSFVPLKTRNFRFLEMIIDKGIENITNYVIEFIKKYQNPEEMLRLVIKGTMTLEQQRTLIINELVKLTDQLFFHIDFDFQLHLEGHGRIFLEKLENPFNVFEEHINQQIENTSDKNRKYFLEKVKSIGLQYLGENLDSK